MNPKMRELSEIIFSSNTSGRMEGTSTLAPPKSTVRYTVEDITNGVHQQAKDAEEEKEEKAETKSSKQEEQTETKLYRWTDENGKVHFSDKPIKSKP